MASWCARSLLAVRRMQKHIRVVQTKSLPAPFKGHDVESTVIHILYALSSTLGGVGKRFEILGSLTLASRDALLYSLNIKQ